MSTCFTSNVKLVKLWSAHLQRMRSAMLVRTQLINEGTSAAAHLSLEHMLRGELGE